MTASSNGNGSFTDGSLPPWLERASDLLAEPDPGPTEWLVQDVAVDQSLIATVGRWKTTKTYWNLDMAISVTTGLPLLNRLQVATPGTVVLVLEESGRKALWRRLDALCRGRAIDRDKLSDLTFAANKRVRLDDPKWQNDLVDAGKELRPRLYIFDPLARMKSPGRDESAQKEFASVIEYMRDLRDETGAAVQWTHHTGHQGDQQRGTSDLESVWESRQGFKRDGSTVTVTIEHREAESGLEINYRLDWDDHTRSIRLEEIDPPDAQKTATVIDQVLAYVTEHPGASGNDIIEAIGHRAQYVRKIIAQLQASATLVRGPGTRVRKDGRTLTVDGLFLAQQATFNLRPDTRTHQDAQPDSHQTSRDIDADIPF